MPDVVPLPVVVYMTDLNWIQPNLIWKVRLATLVSVDTGRGRVANPRESVVSNHEPDIDVAA